MSLNPPPPKKVHTYCNMMPAYIEQHHVTYMQYVLNKIHFRDLIRDKTELGL